MTTTLDLVFAVVVGIVWPVFEWRVSWPAFQRRARTDPSRARMAEYFSTLVIQWTLAVACFLLLRHEGRSLGSIGVTGVTGWRLAVAIAPSFLLAAALAWNIGALRRSARARTVVRGQAERMGHFNALLPRRADEAAWFIAISITAGICEELLFRGFLWKTLANGIGLWPAAVVACALFGLLHAYQGQKGVINTTLVGVAMTAFVAITGSVIPAMVLHALIDIQSGSLSYIALRPESAVLPAA